MSLYRAMRQQWRSKLELTIRTIKRIAATLKNPSLGRPSNALCTILKSRAEIETCTRYLHRYGYASHILRCKDWDLAHILPEIGDGNFLDMGSSDSYILKNVSIKRVQGELHGIDLREPDVPIPGVKYVVGDLTSTGYPDQYFDTITCLSVIEHDVDIRKFAAETSRLLKPGGRLYVTFDYWDPFVRSPIRMYERAWQPLDKDAVLRMISACQRTGLDLVQPMEWATGDAVINKDYYSPHPSMSYTFGLVTFEKKPRITKARRTRSKVRLNSRTRRVRG